MMVPAAGPRLTLDQMRAFRTFVEDHRKNTPESAPPTVEEWLEYCSWSTENEALFAAAAAPNAPDIRNVLDPRLRSPAAAPHIAAASAPVAERNPRRRSRALQSETSDSENADDESSGTESEPSRRKRKRKARRGRKRAKIDRPLTKDGVELSESQETTYDELHEAVVKQLMELTGLSKNPFIFRLGDPEPPTPPVKDGCMEVFWTEAVNFKENDDLIKRAALFIYNRETNKHTWTITHKNVRFTLQDVEHMAKEGLRVWKTSYTNKKDPAKTERYHYLKMKNRRDMRQRLTKTRRERACKLYTAKHPHLPNPKALLQTPYMTEENSDLDDLTPDQKAALAKQLSPDDIRRGTKVLEVLQPLWRASLSTNIFHELDDLHYEDLKQRRKSAGQTCRRVDLARGRMELPEGEDQIYPMLVSKQWLRLHPEEQSRLRKKNPRGFAADLGTDSNPESSSSSSDDGDDGPTKNGKEDVAEDGQGAEDAAGEGQGEEEAA